MTFPERNPVLDELSARSAPSATGSSSPSTPTTRGRTRRKVVQIPGNDEPFPRIDRINLSCVGPPTPNPPAGG
jgi:hypothetical protein